MEKELDEILKSHVVTSSETEVKDKLLAAGFVVVDKDDILYTGTAGRLDFDPSSPPYGPDSVSWLASMTKLATAVCLLQLVERGIIGLDDDVSGKLPELAAQPVLRGFDDDGKPRLEAHEKAITLRHLLSHTVAIGVDMADPDLKRWAAQTGRCVDYMSYTLEGITTPLRFAPGEGWYYGTAYDWAGVLLTRLTGTSLESYMRANVFVPLGMTSTSFHHPGEDHSGEEGDEDHEDHEDGKDISARTLAYAIRDPDTGVLKPGSCPVPKKFRRPVVSFEAGGSGLFSTPADFARLLRGILAHTVLSPLSATTDLLFAPQLNDPQRDILSAIATYARTGGFSPELPPDAPLDHGLGGLLGLADVPGKRRRGSLMWSGATNGRWWIDRETGIAGAVFTQVEPHGDPVVVRMYDELERAVYRGRLGGGGGAEEERKGDDGVCG